MEAPILANLQNLPLFRKRSPTHDSKNWNLLIRNQAKLRNDHGILTTYTRMESLGILPDATTAPLILKACANTRDLERGKRIHRDLMNTGLIDDVRFGTSLVGFYCKCGCFEDALYMFDYMPQRDLVAWNAMISGCVECSEYEKALRCFVEMQMENLRPNSRTLVSVLLACGQLLEFCLGKEIHGYCLRNGILVVSDHVGSALVRFYSRFDMWLANGVFRLLDSRSTVIWNAMLTGYLEAGDYLKLLELFILMLRREVNYDGVTVLVVLQACAEMGCFNFGLQMHQFVIKHNLVADLPILNELIHMYKKMGKLKSTYNLFSFAPYRDIALWNSILCAYVESGFQEEAISFFRKMQSEGVKPNEGSIIVMLSYFAQMENGLRNGRSLHAHVIKSGRQSNAYSRNALLSMYGKLGCVEEVLQIFSETLVLDVVSWNTVISALAQNNVRSYISAFFRQMMESDINPNSHTAISMLASCNDKSFLPAGKSIHGYVIKAGFEMDASLNTALSEMYMNCGDEETALSLFERFRNKDIISWNAMIANYVNIDQAHKALLLFHQMVSNVEPNSSTIINAISACTHFADLPQGLCLHGYAIRRDWLSVSHLTMGNALITMYAKCCKMQYAERIFKALARRNSVTWNAIIAGYGSHGRGSDAVLAFSQMLEEGFIPTDVTFVSVLSACSHSGLIEDGLQLYHSMIQKFYIIPKLVHYSCVVDLLCRGGRLDEAMDFINSMPIAPDASVWRALLGACRIYAETRHMKIIFDKLVELEPRNAGNYILLSNVYAAAGLWSEVKRLRLDLENNGLIKPPGKSWIVIRNKLHQFTAGDESHPQCDRIYEKLSSLLSSIKARGYVPDLSWVLHEEEDEEKLKRLSSHSEKLAIAFALISVVGKGPILITKNLRVCGDCHEFSKYVSKLVNREIVLRDRSRFHHFSNGVCSCKDYW